MKRIKIDKATIEVIFWVTVAYGMFFAELLRRICA